MFNKKTEDDDSSFWLSYTDLITGFMVVFIILVLWYSTQNKEKVAVENKYAELRTQFDKKFKNQKDIEVTKDEGTIRFLTTKTLLFENGEDKLTDSFKEKLNKFIPLYFDELYNSYKEQNEKKEVFIKEIRIEGHASSEGKYIDNLDLSSKRALEVYKYILNSSIYQNKYPEDFKKFIKKQTISCGYSSSRSLNKNGKFANNYKDEDFNKSRRVEFRVLLEYKTNNKN